MLVLNSFCKKSAKKLKSTNNVQRIDVGRIENIICVPRTDCHGMGRQKHIALDNVKMLIQYYAKM